MSAKTTTDETGFEKNLERLESIVEEMESGELNLDQMMAHFEEGMQLTKTCTKRLHEVEQKIEILVKKGNEVTSEPFEASETGD